MEWWHLENVADDTDYEDQGNGKEDEEDKVINIVPPIKAIIKVRQEPVELPGKKRKKRLGYSIAVDPEFTLLPGAGGTRTRHGLCHQGWQTTNRVHDVDVSRMWGAREPNKSSKDNPRVFYPLCIGGLSICS